MEWPLSNTNKERLFSGMMEHVKRYINRRLRFYGGRHKDADDLLQEAYVAVWEGLDKFDHNRGSDGRAWARKVGFSGALEFLNREKRVTPYQRNKVRWFEELQQLIELIDKNGHDLTLLGLLEQHLSKKGVNMSIEEMESILSFRDEDRALLLSGMSNQEWARLKSYALQLLDWDINQPLPGEEGDQLLDVIPEIKEDNTLRESLQRAVDTLPSELQVIIVLHDLLGLSMDEVAYVDGRGRTTQALYQARLKALEQLKEALSKDGETGDTGAGGEYPRSATL